MIVKIINTWLPVPAIPYLTLTEAIRLLLKGKKNTKSTYKWTEHSCICCMCGVVILCEEMEMVTSPSISFLMSTWMSPFIDLMIFLLICDVYNIVMVVYGSCVHGWEGVVYSF